MRDFIMSALPFVIIAVCVAVMAANFVGIKRKEKAENYMSQGMCLGMCLGVTVSSVFHLDMALSISLGLLIGETVGLMMKKDSKEE